MSKILIEQLIGSFLIKYDRLSQLIDEAINSDSNFVNVYIDLYSIFKPLYDREEHYDIKDYSIVTSCIINMCAHYRSFFKFKYGVYANIYLVCSFNMPHMNRQFMYGYNNRMISKYEANGLVHDMIKYNIELLTILCDYLPSIYMVNGTFETGTIIYDLICRKACVCSDPNIIITRDVYNYQIAAINNNITILRPKKTAQADESYYMNCNNVLLSYVKDRDCELHEDYLKLSPLLLSTMMSLGSIKERNIKMITSLSKARSLLVDAVSNNRLFNGYNSLPITIWNSIDNASLKVAYNEFENRFKSIDIIFGQSVYMNTPEAKSLKFLDLVDPKTIQQINNQYFVNNPLDLENL